MPDNPDRTKTFEAQAIITAALRKHQPRPIDLYWHEHKHGESPDGDGQRTVEFCTLAVLAPACLQ